MTTGAFTTKLYGGVIYGKWTAFVVNCSKLETNTLTRTNALAYYGVRRLRVRNVVVVHAPGH